VLRALRRRAGSEPEDRPADGPADEILDRLLDPEEIIDRFDASYVDDLPQILREVHGVTPENVREHALWDDLSELWELSSRPVSEFSLAALPAVLIDEIGVDPARHAPLRAGAQTQRRFKYVKTRSWRKAEGLQLGNAGESDATARDAVNAIQKEFSLLSGGKHELEFDDLARPETGDPWSPLMIDLRERGVVSEDEPVLTIGPRWVGEIHYFRDRLGLKGTIGLDLFSRDSDLIKVGDMHEMPFEDNTFGLVYQRNTFDKSYDIRRALAECVRVLRDGGVLITDDCYAYTAGVSEMSRTNIKHNRQLIRALEPHVAEVLHDDEPDSNEDWIERVGQLAVRITK
jgi:SAM-dependent methyltransferase